MHMHILIYIHIHMPSTNIIHMRLGLENMQENQLNYLQTLAHGRDTRSDDPTSSLEGITGMEKPLGMTTGRDPGCG